MKLKEKYFIFRVSRYTTKKLLDPYHYLHKEGNFRSGINYGLIHRETNKIVGVCVFHSNSAKGIIKGCFGIDSFKLDGFFELGRLCINPHYHERNLTSFLVGGAIKLLRKNYNVRCLLSYADSHNHAGFIYQACNFKYYGLTDKKKDFFYIQEDGSFKKLQRGKCKHLKGEWRDKSQKHRYLLIYDCNLETKWKELKYPKNNVNIDFNKNTSKLEDFSFVPHELSQMKLF